jgi:MFS family permease
VRHERSAPHPMLDTDLFRHRRFTTGICSGIGSYVVMFGVLLLVPFYLTRGLGFGTARAGLELMVLPVMFGVGAPLAGKVADRVGARPLTASGLAIVAAGLAALALLRPDTTGFLALLGLVGAGLGLFTAPNNATVMGSVPAAQAGMASGIVNMSRGLGTALGLSLTGLLFTVSGGASGSPVRADHAFTVTALGLAAIAVAAGAVATSGRSTHAAHGVGPQCHGASGCELSGDGGQRSPGRAGPRSG